MRAADCRAAGYRQRRGDDGRAGPDSSVKSLTIHGAGVAPNAGQNRLPDDELPVRKINEYTPPIDLANGRMRVQQMTPSTPRRPARSVRIGDCDGNDIQLNYSR